MDQLKGEARSLVEENRMHMSRSLSIILKTCSGPLNLRCCGIVGMLLALQPCSSSILTNKILEAALTEKKKTLLEVYIGGHYFCTVPARRQVYMLRCSRTFRLQCIVQFLFTSVTLMLLISLINCK